MKTDGYEERVAAALHEHGLGERALVSTMENSSLALLRARHPELAPGLVAAADAPQPAAPTRSRALPGARPSWPTCAARCPGVAANRIRRGEIDALMAHWRLVTPRLADAIRGAGGELYAWTVDDAARIADARALRRHGRHLQRPAAVRPVTRAASLVGRDRAGRRRVARRGRRRCSSGGPCASARSRCARRRPSRATGSRPGRAAAPARPAVGSMRNERPNWRALRPLPIDR